MPTAGRELRQLSAWGAENFRLGTTLLRALVLTRISHQLSAAATDPGMSTALRSVGHLDVLSSTPAAPSGRSPCIHPHLRRFAAKPGEKCGLRLLVSAAAAGSRASACGECIAGAFGVQFARGKFGMGRSIARTDGVRQKTLLCGEDAMNLMAKKIPDEFIRAIPRGFRLIRKQDHDFLLLESLFCPNGHNLVVDSVRIHDEASIKLKIVINGEPGHLFLDAFWGSHAKLFSAFPHVSAHEPIFVEIFCPYCDANMTERHTCAQKGCGSDRSVLLMLPGGKNKIHVCAKLGCPGHLLEINDMPQKLVRSVSVINYFGAGTEDLFGGF
jgi:hypothetical protein